ncbi:MAG: tRNA epoxyqueuosine(34) reductase QueG [Magnetococcales bacterium]|nr:tRNA epoxyqueuosine(34) reductase QueG [Magnetococcales bacterium]
MTFFLADPWHDLKEALRRQARVVGFDVAGFASPLPPPHAQAFACWTGEGHHGDMSWLERHGERRQDPRRLWPDVQSILVLGSNYRPPGDPLGCLQDPESMGLSAYARNRDYHLLLMRRLKVLHRWLETRLNREVPARLFVDTAPVLEKPLAVQAGLGWQGKNTLLVSRRFGCWLFLAEMFLSLPLPSDKPERDHCGDCRRCLDACPTGALSRPYWLEARRCLAYLTIESRGEIPAAYRRLLKNRVYGCDDCLAVCPFNRFAPTTREPDYLARPILQSPRLRAFADITEERFREVFRHTSIKRLGRVRFLRNLEVALHNADTITDNNATSAGTHPSPEMEKYPSGQLTFGHTIRQLIDRTDKIS